MVFFPNAPYILTDGLHVIGSDARYLVFDVFIWLYISGIAFWIALLSLYDIEMVIKNWKSNSILVHFCIILIILLSGYGIYLGRDLRLNSWDVIRRPFLLSENIIQTFTNTTPGYFNWNAVWFYSSILYVGYLISIIYRKYIKSSN